MGDAKKRAEREAEERREWLAAVSADADALLRAGEELAERIQGPEFTQAYLEQCRAAINAAAIRDALADVSAALDGLPEANALALIKLAQAAAGPQQPFSLVTPPPRSG
jgi:hypothetical protein